MKNINQTIKYSLIESENQLTDIYGGIGIPDWFITKMVNLGIWLNDKIDEWVESII